MLNMGEFYRRSVVTSVDTRAGRGRTVSEIMFWIRIRYIWLHGQHQIHHSHIIIIIISSSSSSSSLYWTAQLCARCRTGYRAASLQSIEPSPRRLYKAAWPTAKYPKVHGMPGQPIRLPARAPVTVCKAPPNFTICCLSKFWRRHRRTLCVRPGN